MTRTFIPALVIASALAAPAFAFAQDNKPLTRAEVKAQLVQLEQTGYVPGEDDVHYPADIQAAEQRVAAQHDIAATSYGSYNSGTSASGHASSGSSSNTESVYVGD
jgi:hypothetical protein